MMKSTLVASITFAAAVKGAVQGFDISHYEPNVNFPAAYAAGARFVIIQATEGGSYRSPSFVAQYTGATNSGFIRGGYHIAQPGVTSGEAQAEFFSSHGGGWSGDGITLPGMLDLISGPDGGCSGLSPRQMVLWIKSFSDQYHSRQGVYPMLYTSPSWWNRCTGDSNAFAQTNPLVLGHYSSSVGTIPGGWLYQTIWQNSDAYPYGGNSDVFNGDLNGLRRLATG